MKQYLDERRAISASRPTATAMGRIGRTLFPPKLRPLAKVAATQAIGPSHRRKLRRLVLERGLTKLHLGCGATRLPGWVNIDLFGTNADVFWDLRKPIPLPDGCVDAFFHEHLIEHLPYADAIRLTSECFRLLRPGGVLRIGMPDFRSYAKSYLGQDGFIDEIRPNRPTRLLAFAEVFYESGHCSMWNVDTLALLAAEAGFENFRESPFGDSVLGRIDSANRAGESLYIEVRKPEEHAPVIVKRGGEL